jgi:hypothetical protein
MLILGLHGSFKTLAASSFKHNLLAKSVINFVHSFEDSAVQL